MVYLVDPATGHLRFAHDAGIRSRRSRAWVRSIDLPVGVGMFGRAVAERAVVLTGDYLDDPAFTHAEETDRVVARHRHPVDGRRRRSWPATTVFGAIGTFSSRADAFSPAADRPRPGAGRPCRRGDEQRPPHRGPRRLAGELAKRADVERTLREIGGPDQRRRATCRPCSS